MSFFGLILTALVTGLHVYVFQRLDSIAKAAPRVNRKIVFAIGLGIWLLFILGRLLHRHDLNAISTIFDIIVMHWIGIVFLLAFCLFIADIVTCFGLTFRAARFRIRAAALMLGVALTLLAHIQGLRPPAIVSYDVTLNNLPPQLDKTTIAVMSDLHAGEMMIGPRWLNARVKQVQALNPDAVMLVGDLFERQADPEEFAPIISQLSPPLGVWAVRGNHDSLYYNRNDVTGKILRDAGIPLLSNESVTLADGLILAGIDDLTVSRRHSGQSQANIDSALTNRTPGTTIFLSHTPWMTEQAAQAGVSLMLSGHTHNGQIWPFNYLVRTVYPYLTGRYDINGMTLIVCRGTGTWGPRMRLWKPGEISFITLRSPKQEPTPKTKP